MSAVPFVLATVTANTGAHVCLKRSAIASNRTVIALRVRGFLLWQVAGNLAALAGTLAYTALLRGMSLHVAYPLTEGLTAIGVQVVGSLLVFRERITPLAWAGTGLIVLGIVLFSL